MTLDHRRERVTSPAPPRRADSIAVQALLHPVIDHRFGQTHVAVPGRDELGDGLAAWASGQAATAASATGADPRAQRTTPSHPRSHRGRYRSLPTHQALPSRRISPHAGQQNNRHVCKLRTHPEPHSLRVRPRTAAARPLTPTRRRGTSQALRSWQPYPTVHTDSNPPPSPRRRGAPRLIRLPLPGCQRTGALDGGETRPSGSQRLPALLPKLTRSPGVPRPCRGRASRRPGFRWSTPGR